MQNSEKIIAFCASNALVHRLYMLLCSQALGSLGPTDPLDGVCTFTSAWIIYRAVEMRGREAEYFT